MLLLPVDRVTPCHMMSTELEAQALLVARWVYVTHRIAAELSARAEHASMCVRIEL